MTEAHSYQHPGPPSGYRGASAPPSGYRNLYGGFAVVAFVLSATQFYAREAVEGYPERETLWTLLGSRWGAGLAMISLLLLFGMVALAICGAVRSVRTVGLPIAVVVLSLVGAVMLMTKVGFSQPAPPFDDGGAMLVTLAWGGVLLGLVHTVHLLLWRRDNKPRR